MYECKFLGLFVYVYNTEQQLKHSIICALNITHHNGHKPIKAPLPLTFYFAMLEFATAYEYDPNELFFVIHSPKL